MTNEKTTNGAASVLSAGFGGSDELLKIHTILMAPGDCPDTGDDDTLTVRALKVLIHDWHRTVRERDHYAAMDALHIQSLGISQAENAAYKKSVDMNYLSGLDAANKKQASEIERLNCELQQRAKDANRLLWLLEHWWFGNDSGVDFGSALTEDEVRATIDGAMLKTPNA